MEHNPSREANSHSVKKFPVLYGTRMFITVLAKAPPLVPICLNKLFLKNLKVMFPWQSQNSENYIESCLNYGFNVTLYFYNTNYTS